MAPADDEAPEVAPQSFPEVSQHQHLGHGHLVSSPPHYGYQQPYQTPHSPAKPEQVYTPVASSTLGVGRAATTEHSQKKSGKGTICGCTILVFILSCIIAVLSAAVIGLAAGTGVEANRANDATNKLAALNASIASPTKTAPAPTGTAGFNLIDNGCTANPTGVTGTIYRVNKQLGNTSFTMYCNNDATGTNLLGLWVSDFSTCMDTCAAYTKYTSTNFAPSNATRCAALSFIPAWTDKDFATAGSAPGNCYLKSGPYDLSDLVSNPPIGTECHAAVIVT